MSFACWTCTSLRASRPWSRIFVSRSLSPCCSTVRTDLSLLSSLLIWLLLRRGSIACRGFIDSQRRAQLLLRAGVTHDVVKYLFELVISIHFGQKVGKLPASID